MQSATVVTSAGCLRNAATKCLIVIMKTEDESFNKTPMQEEPPEQDENPMLEDLRAEIGRYDDEPSDDSGGWDLGKEELL